MAAEVAVQGARAEEGEGGVTVTTHRITMAEYLADPCDVPSLSSSCAFKLITRSPLHAWRAHPRLGGAVREDSGVADVGTVAHDLLLGGEGKICEIDPRNYPSTTGSIPDGWTNKAIRAARDQARANGLTPVLAGAMAGARAMVKVAHEFIHASEIKGVFDDGEPELTVIWQEEDVWCRIRPDWLTTYRRWYVAYKTSAADIGPNSFSRLADNMGYCFSQEFYARGLRAAGECTAGARQVILAQSQQPPYACALYDLTPAKSAIESSQVQRAINTWRACMERDVWPGYSPRICSLDVKPWQIAEEEERLQEEEA